MGCSDLSPIELNISQGNMTLVSTGADNPSVSGTSDAVEDTMDSGGDSSDGNRSDSLTNDDLSTGDPPAIDKTPESGSVTESITQWNGFKIVGDNLDKTVKPQYMRINPQTKSLNYFSCFDVKDRIDLSSLSSFSLVVNFDTPVEDMLPSCQDRFRVLNTLAVLVSRILVCQFSSFTLEKL